MKIKFLFSVAFLMIFPIMNFAQSSVDVELIADNLVSPVSLAEAPDDSKKLFIVDQIGLIRIYTPEGELLEKPFLDIQEKIVPLEEEHEERGLLGLAFHPEYKDNGLFYVYYSAPLREEAPEGWNHTSHISEYKISGNDPNMANPDSEKIIMYVDEPQDNHNAGTLAFGPDGYLYISLGDGGGADDKDLGHVQDWYEENNGGNGQDIEQNLLGSILRIDVDGESPYGIPLDNPFIDKPGMDEIYAYGLRNPYRFSFDMEGSNELIAGDVGQELWEEVDVITKGGNYGWNVKEATHCFNAAEPKHPLGECPQTGKDGEPLIAPVLEFRTGGLEDGGKGLAVIGGYVYRGDEIEDLQGMYVFGTWSQHHGEPKGAIFVANMQETGMWDFEEMKISGISSHGLGHYLLGFGQNNDGEIFALTTDENGPVGNTGKVYKMVAQE